MKKIFVDIDNTICKTDNGDYEHSEPYNDRIAYINYLYDSGHIIVYWTARGAVSGFDWSNFTANQLQSWGCKYDELRCNKPSYDMFIDDKTFNSDVFFHHVSLLELQ